VKFYEKEGNYENDIKENKHNTNIGSLKMKPFQVNEVFFQIVMIEKKVK
jgi:hypothetical protein